MSPDVAGGLFFAALGVWALVKALDYHISGSVALSPALFPILASAVLVSLALYQIRMEIKRGKAEPGRSRDATKIKVVGIVFSLCLLYTAALQKVGFVVTTVTYLVVFLIVLGEKRPVVIFLVPVAAAGAIYFFFEKALSVMLP